jgi:hypothetical protein
MKSQNDLIAIIVSILIAIGCVTGFWFTKREPTRPADPTPVPLGEPKFTPGSVVMSNALPNAGQAQGGDQAGGGGEGEIVQPVGGMGGAPAGPVAAGVSQ